MIWLPIWLFLALSANAKLESEFTDLKSRAVDSTSNDGDKCNATTINNIQCENDMLKFCGPDNKIMSVQCVVNGRQGFCNCEKTGCVAEKPTCSEQTDCYQPHTKLPDNLNCRKFSYCDGNSKQSVFQCPGNLVYNMTAEKCTDSAPCRRVTCPRPGNTVQLVPFPQAREYYVLCYKGMVGVRKCPDKYYAVRNNMCQFDCSLRKESGLFKDSNKERCEKGFYYACRRSGTNFTTVQSKCANGLTFDENLGICTEQNTCTDTPQT